MHDVDRRLAGWNPACRNCGNTITRHGSSAKRSPTGWSHWGEWEGIRCPGRLTGAEPVDAVLPEHERRALAGVEERGGT